MNTTNPSTKIDSLQAIRGFASIGVLLAHGTEMLQDKLGYLVMNNMSMVGVSGVDIFFVLSGFIILYSSSFGKTNVSSFIKKRIIRIYPIYWIVTALLISLYFISPTLEQAHKGDLGVILGSLSLFPQENYVVGVAWTLTYEVIFYLVFAMTYFKSPAVFFYAFTGWAAIILIFYFFNIKSGVYAIDAFTKPIILEFVFGCLVAYFYKKFSDFKYYGWFLWGGLILLISMWSFYYQLKISESEAFSDDMARVYFFGLPAAFLIFGALYLPVLVPKILVFFGDASYSLYLVHGTVLSLLIKIILKLNYVNLFGNFIGAIILFISTLFISCFFYSLVEKRLLTFLNQLVLQRKFKN